MKSEERHELKRNDLATGLSDLPNFWARHGNKVLMLIAAAALIYFAVQYRRNQAAEQSMKTRSALASAWAGVEQLRQYGGLPSSPEIDKVRGTLESDVNQNVQTVIDDNAATATQSAWAWLARGELYWTLAHMHPAASPTTGPASQPATKPANDPLALASNAYKSVVDGYAGVAEAAKLAHFGLAAVAEEKGDWSAARTQYKAVIESTKIAEADKTLATTRLAKLDSIEKPTLLLPATQPVAEKPAIDPLAALAASSGSLTGNLGPIAPPATRPATSQPAASQPAAIVPAIPQPPASQPASQPAAAR